MEFVNIPNLKEKLEEELFNIVTSGKVDVNTIMYVDRKGNLRRYEGTLQQFLSELPNKLFFEWFIVFTPYFFKYIQEECHTKDEIKNFIRYNLDSFFIFSRKNLELNYELLQAIKDFVEISKIEASMPFDLDENTHKTMFKEIFLNRRLDLIWRLLEKGLISEDILDKFIKTGNISQLQNDIANKFGQKSNEINERRNLMMQKIKELKKKLLTSESAASIPEEKIDSINNFSESKVETKEEEKGFSR